MQKIKLLPLFILAITDTSLCFYSYQKLANFNEFNRIIDNSLKTLNHSDLSGTLLDSPDFKLELFKVFLQSFVFVSLSLVFFHLVIYVLSYKEKKFAMLYVRYYSLLAAVSVFASVFAFNEYPILLAALAYFYAFLKTQKIETKNSTPIKTAE